MKELAVILRIRPLLVSSDRTHLQLTELKRGSIGMILVYLTEYKQDFTKLGEGQRCSWAMGTSGVSFVPPAPFPPLDGNR